MKRYSTAWWLAILPTTLVVGVPVFLLLGYQTDWSTAVRIGAALTSALVVDVATAAWMERIAPTKVRIGPGERKTDTENASEEAIVLSGFEGSAAGRVSVRGESWSAVRCPNDTEDLAAGMTVSVVDRVGLNLVVSARST